MEEYREQAIPSSAKIFVLWKLFYKEADEAYAAAKAWRRFSRAFWKNKTADQLKSVLKI